MSKSEQMLHECPYTACKGKQLQAELATAKKQILEYEQTEAAVCPEDVGAKEYVESLKSQLATAKEENSDLCDNVDAARQDVEDYTKSMAGWIPVGEGLPDDNDNVLVLLKYPTGNATLVGNYNAHKATAMRWSTYATSIVACITHWRPITLPEGE